MPAAVQEFLIYTLVPIKSGTLRVHTRQAFANVIAAIDACAKSMSFPPRVRQPRSASLRLRFIAFPNSDMQSFTSLAAHLNRSSFALYPCS